MYTEECNRGECSSCMNPSDCSCGCHIPFAPTQQEVDKDEFTEKYGCPICHQFPCAKAFVGCTEKDNKTYQIGTKKTMPPHNELIEEKLKDINDKLEDVYCSWDGESFSYRDKKWMKNKLDEISNLTSQALMDVLEKQIQDLKAKIEGMKGWATIGGERYLKFSDLLALLNQD